MKPHQRKRILISLAAKKAEKLNGKHTRKSVEKQLEKAKKQYSEMKSKLKSVETDLKGLNELVENYREGVADSRDVILACHEIMKKMDTISADEVKVKDNQDVAYLSDGKWVVSNADGSTISLSEYKKKEKETQDVSDANDFNEGFEVTK